jgi:hypothetical protein
MTLSSISDRRHQAQSRFVSRCVERMASNQTYDPIARKDENKENII